MKKAALYLRSSKDRSDISIDAQRRELKELAESKQFTIVKEFSDTVESAKDEDRQGFQDLLLDLKSHFREWDTLLITDTSRLSRRQYMAYAFDHEAKKRGITIIYSKLPETDPITDMVIKGVFRVFDELHSLMSRQKGLAGMRENVNQGWRAGGRAPIGYKLKHINTGTIREGVPVTKSKLVVDDNSKKIKDYLIARVNGIPRGRIDTDMNKSSLVDIEWNALLYAGHTVWNMRNPKSEGRKRRPRSEWLIKRDTHESLISNEDAETLLKRLESSTQGNRSGRKYLLSGIMVTPDGKPWSGTVDRGKSFYRTKGKRISAIEIEEAITNQVKSDILSDQFITDLTNSVRERYLHQHDLNPLTSQIRAVSDKIDALLDISLEMTNKAPVLRKVERLESDRETLESELRDLKEENDAASSASKITESQVKKIIQWDEFDIKDSLPSLVERIVLDPKTTSCEVIYGVKMASPRGFEPLLPP